MPKLDSELRLEVQEYLAEMNATKAERNDVWYWVHHGVDIYDNPWFYYNDAGWPADLVTALRMDRDLREENVSTKVVKIIQSYTDYINRTVWKKN